jgi:hypothetical protein
MAGYSNKSSGILDTLAALDTLYFNMFDADQSLEITWPEFCIGTDKIMRPEYENMEQNLYDMSVEDWKIMTTVTENYAVDLYDFNNDGFITEEEWVKAQIQIN